MIYWQTMLAALAVVVVITPLVKVVAGRFGFIDRPDERKVHREAVARIGGVGIFVGFLVAVNYSLYFSQSLAAILAGGLLLVVVGLLDDRYSLPARVKLVGQIAAALVPVASGIRIEEFSNPWGGMIFLPGWLSAAVSVVWIVGLTNTVNLIDGLDGLAAGITAIASLTVLAVAVAYHFHMVAVLTAALAGACVGFLFYNFNPASIFMGDTGSMFLGYLLAVTSIYGTAKGVAAIALIVPLLALGVPVADTALAIIRRRLTGQPIFKPDKLHLHHRLLAIGLSHRQTVLVMYLISALLGLAALATTIVDRDLAVAILMAVVLLMVAGAVKIGMIPRRNGKGEERTDKKENDG
ncbi:MAG: undecaprenyl/decaprenyl-phosphate alpha-N-acetylglucosaminyl 1-phosphate transferase [Negativicutes bacterium]|nr:undecaprenyl/decaprenyl-phosphate alpha-N-acetylglucosaminyl 1-phosphate transferase [Negativicutes bacterium]